MKLLDLFFKFLTKLKITQLETKLSAFLGTYYRDKILKQKPIEGEISKIYMTRAKIKNSSKNLIFRTFITEEFIKSANPDVYEVVYHCKLKTKDNKTYVLSLFPNQLELQCQKATIEKYNCIYHIGHYFIIGSNLEIYPVEYKINYSANEV